MFIWSQIACRSSRRLETSFFSEFWIFQVEAPSRVKRRVMMMVEP
jgi:hypothetical protein